MSKTVVFAVLCICASLPLQDVRAENVVKQYEAGEIVVTSTRKKTIALDIPASVTIMTAEDIDKSGYNSTPELIGSLPGVTNLSQGNSYSFDFRGTKSSDSHGPHILIDGRDVNLGIFGFNILGSIPLEIIEKIEIVRTPGAYISGRDASRGVINIITKTGEGEGNAFSPAFDVSYGSWDTFSGSVSATGEKGEFNYFINAAYKESEGYRRTSPKYTSLLGSLDYDLSDALVLGIDVDYRKEERNYALGLKEWQLDEYRRADEIPSSQSATAYMKKQNSIENEAVGSTVSLNYDAKPYRAGISLNVIDYEDHYRKNTYANSPSMKKYNYKKDRSQDIFDLKVFGGREYVLGASVSGNVEVGYDYSSRTGDQKTYYPFDPSASARLKEEKETIDYEERYHGVFVNNELDLDRFSLGTGLRYELTDYEMSSRKPKRVESDFNKLAWNIAPSYEVFPKGNLYCNVARSYFYPTAGYFYYAMDKDSEHNLPEDLKPEETTSYEVGFKHNYTDWLRYTVNVFYMDVADRFLSFYDDSGSWKGWKNVGNSTNQGVEVTVEGMPLDWLGYDFSFSYVDAEWDSGSVRVYEYGDTPADDVKKNMDLSGKKVAKVPDVQYRMGLQFVHPVERLRMNVGLSYVGESYVDPWNRYKEDAVYLVDAKITYEFDKWSVYVAGENIFDVEYEKIGNSSSDRNSDGSPNNTYYPKDGRYVAAGFSYRF